MECGPVILLTTNDGKNNNIMTISWSMVMDFSATFAITTGAWNYSYSALKNARECVIAIPSAEMINTVIDIGLCSGDQCDKFQQFNLTALPSQYVNAPLIKECMANIECNVIDIIDKYDIVVLTGVAAYLDEAFHRRKMIHAIGDGTFVIDGQKIDRKARMQAKLPD